MEECSALLCDCIVVSCCCQCLVLRVAIFVFVQLPCRMARRMKAYAKRKMRRRRRKARQGGGGGGGDHEHEQSVARKERLVNHDRDELKMVELKGMMEDVNELHEWGSCMNEVDKVLGELSLKGEFGFGSFWGRNGNDNHQIIETRTKCYCKCSSPSFTKEEELEFGSHVVIKVSFHSSYCPFSPQ